MMSAVERSISHNEETTDYLVPPTNRESLRRVFGNVFSSERETDQINESFCCDDLKGISPQIKDYLGIKENIFTRFLRKERHFQVSVTKSDRGVSIEIGEENGDSSKRVMFDYNTDSKRVVGNKQLRNGNDVDDEEWKHAGYLDESEKDLYSVMIIVEGNLIKRSGSL